MDILEHIATTVVLKLALTDIQDVPDGKFDEFIKYIREDVQDMHKQLQEVFAEFGEEEQNLIKCEHMVLSNVIVQFMTVAEFAHKTVKEIIRLAIYFLISTGLKGNQAGAVN